MKNPVVIKDSKRYGRGLYAARNIRKGELIEVSPVIELGESSGITASKLNLYVFGWRNSHSSALALGLGSLFNHSKKRNNVTYRTFFENMTICFYAIKDVKRGKQLFINYGYDVKHGIEVTEKNIFQRLKQKFEPDKSKYSMLPLKPERSSDTVQESAAAAWKDGGKICPSEMMVTRPTGDT